MAIGKEEIRNRWGYHPATPETAGQHEAVREAYIALAEYLDQILPDGRAKSTAFTKLQESSMWANFGVAEQAPVRQSATNQPPRPAMAAKASVPMPTPPRNQTGRFGNG